MGFNVTFFESGFLLKELNHTIITLIPKGENSRTQEQELKTYQHPENRSPQRRTLPEAGCADCGQL